MKFESCISFSLYAAVPANFVSLALRKFSREQVI